jgi:hypothetical protein
MCGGHCDGGHRGWVSVVSDAHSTWDLRGETAAEIIARYNAAFTAAGVNLVTTRSLTGV